MPWFEQHLEERGLVVFTTHGRSVASDLKDGRRAFPVRDVGALVAAYEDEGFGWEPHPGHELRYGISLSSPAWVCRELERYPRLKLVSYTEQGWAGFQDSVAWQRRP